jgi:hypothetical protein
MKPVDINSSVRLEEGSSLSRAVSRDRSSSVDLSIPRLDELDDYSRRTD